MNIQYYAAISVIRLLIVSEEMLNDFSIIDQTCVQGSHSLRVSYDAISRINRHNNSEEKSTDEFSTILAISEIETKGVIEELSVSELSDCENDYDGPTSLICTVRNCDANLVRQLLWAGANVNAVDSQGSSALMYSLSNCHVEIILALLDGGADPNVKGPLGVTALMLAAMDSLLDPSVISILVQYGSALDLQSERDGTALMMASRWNDNPEILRALIECGADVNASDDHGNTPLIVAAKWNRNPDVISVLLQYGASTSSRNDFGETAYICASTWNDNPEVSRTLKDSGISPMVEYYLWFVWDIRRYAEKLMGL